VTDSLRISIRRIVRDDAAATAELSGQLGYPSTVEQLRHRIQSLASCTDSQAVFVARLTPTPSAATPPATTQLVGWIEVAITCHLQSDPFVLIRGFVVKDGLCGHGIGPHLCEKVEARASSQGNQILRVTSRSTRPDAHRFYLQDGYVET
jgi:GNAT superfamily N-acetyltransferase